MKKYCIGVDVGGTTVKLGIFDIVGNIIRKWEIPTRQEENGKFIIEDVAEAITSVCEEYKIGLEELLGVGIGVPGPVMPDGYVEVCVNLGWRDRNPAKELSKLLALPVKASNDANVAALGELWKGGAAGYNSAVLFTLGTGVGGGIIVDNKIIDGAHGVGGELGHMTVNLQEAEACNCGNHGCLEQYASATGVVRTTKKILTESLEPSVLRGKDSFSAKDVFDAAKEGDELALKAVDVLCMYLGMACANCAFTVDPEAFVIGGGVSRAGQILVDGIFKYYVRFTSLTQKKAIIKIATLGNDAGIYGAARLVL